MVDQETVATQRAERERERVEREQQRNQRRMNRRLKWSATKDRRK